jgi:hypothetical protein
MRIQRMEADRDFTAPEEEKEHKEKQKNHKVLPFRNPMVG